MTLYIKLQEFMNFKSDIVSCSFLYLKLEYFSKKNEMSKKKTPKYGVKKRKNNKVKPVSVKNETDFTPL